MAETFTTARSWSCLYRQDQDLDVVKVSAINIYTIEFLYSTEKGGPFGPESLLI